MKTLKRHGKSHLFEFIRYVVAEGFGGEGRGGYIEMATLPNTVKWITPR